MTDLTHAMPPERQKNLVSRNIKVGEHRTSVRLEPEMWEALYEVAELEGCSVNDLCGAVHDTKDPEAPLTGALRVFLMQYYRRAALSSRQLSLVQKRLKVEKIPGKSRRRS
jgi:predicted DNA-binding ribbon-helix-helix protein